MRTTIELDDGQRARLLELAARRGEKGFSNLIAEALAQYLAGLDAAGPARARALATRGCLTAAETGALAQVAGALRESWR
jgi:hypothetical protein